MRRLLPDEVLAAYEATGIRPICAVALHSDKTYGCALGAVAKRQCPEYSGGTGEAIEVLGLTLDYAGGFYRGFDLGTAEIFEYEIMNADQLLGLGDGVAVRAAVEAKYGRIE